MPIRLALVGAGIFIREAHLPNLLKMGDTYQIAAIYSRTADSAQQAAALVPYPVEISHDLPSLLARSDIDAVDIALPILAMPPVIEAALRAGKHVLSEKPIAPSIAHAHALLDLYAKSPQVTWLVAENYRFAPAIQRAAEIIQTGTLGDLALFHWTVCAGMNASRPYYHTAWRRDGSLPGGFVMDGGIHFAGALQAILGNVAQVQAFAQQLRPDLPPLDTVTATLEMESGLLGTLSITYAVGLPWSTTLMIVGSAGVLEVNREGLKVTLNGTVTESLTTPSNGILEELQTFASLIQTGGSSLPHLQGTLADVTLMEGLLRAAQTGQKIKLSNLIPPPSL